MITDVLNHLRNEHRNINSLLLILERQLSSIGTGDRPDYYLMYDIVHYLTYYPDRYHHPGEDMMFARLVEKRPEFSPVVAAIEKQHRQIALEGGRLRDLIGEIINESAVPRQTLCQTGIGYIDTYRGHMQIEEDKLFDALSINLDSTDWMLLTTAFNWQHDPVFSKEVSMEYQHLKNCIIAEGAGDWPWQEVMTHTCPVCSNT